MDELGLGTSSVLCAVCEGLGLLMSDPCPLCEGSGHFKNEDVGTGLVCTVNGEHAIKCGTHLERPERICAIINHLEAKGLTERCCQVDYRSATVAELSVVHSDSLIEQVRRVSQTVLIEDDSCYLTSSSLQCACTAIGATLELVRRVVNGHLVNGFAVVRPPGHHVEVDDFGAGFGVFNNVAVAAAVARRELGVDRVLIVDWDIHHGNGTQHIFETDPSVLYFSLHRYDNGDFFPCSKDAAPQVVGHGAGQGFNINVAWNIAWTDSDGMGDDEYLAALRCVLLPVAREFRPELVLVSAGFDAAFGDVGGCCVTPACFAQMTRMLQSICPKLVLVLEGGYKLGVISECVGACARALLGDAVPMCIEARPKMEARLSIERTLRAHRPFWEALRAGGSSIDVMSARAIPLPSSANAAHTEGPTSKVICDVISRSVMSDDQQERHAQEYADSKTRGRRKKGHKQKPVTGISISTRNAANSNMRNDVKKLNRKQAELQSAVENINAMRQGDLKHARLSAKQRALLEDEDEIIWQLREVSAELQELTSLSKDDVLRMYGGC